MLRVLATATAALLLGITLGITWRGDKADADIAALQLEHLSLAVEAEEAAWEQYHAMETTKNEAIRKHQEDGQRLAAAADMARADVERLRRDLASVPARISTATRTAVDEYAATATAVFEQCSAEVTELARAADGHANDAALMLRAWPTPSRLAGGK